MSYILKNTTHFPLSHAKKTGQIAVLVLMGLCAGERVQARNPNPLTPIEEAHILNTESQTDTKAINALLAQAHAAKAAGNTTLYNTDVAQAKQEEAAANQVANSANVAKALGFTPAQLVVYEAGVAEVNNYMATHPNPNTAGGETPADVRQAAIDMAYWFVHDGSAPTGVGGNGPLQQTNLQTIDSQVDAFIGQYYR